RPPWSGRCRPLRRSRLGELQHPRRGLRQDPRRRLLHHQSGSTPDPWGFAGRDVLVPLSAHAQTGVLPQSLVSFKPSTRASSAEASISSRCHDVSGLVGEFPTLISNGSCTPVLIPD